MYIRVRPRPLLRAQNNPLQLHLHCIDTEQSLLFTVLFKENTCSPVYLILICIFLIILRLQRQSPLPSDSSDRSVSPSHLRITVGNKISTISPVSAIIGKVSGITKHPKSKTKSNFKSSTILLQYSLCLFTSLEDWGGLRWEPKEVTHVCKICQITYLRTAFQSTSTAPAARAAREGFSFCLFTTLQEAKPSSIHVGWGTEAFPQAGKRNKARALEKSFLLLGTGAPGVTGRSSAELCKWLCLRMRFEDPILPTATHFSNTMSSLNVFKHRTGRTWEFLYLSLCCWEPVRV